MVVHGQKWVEKPCSKSKVSSIFKGTRTTWMVRLMEQCWTGHYMTTKCIINNIIVSVLQRFLERSEAGLSATAIGLLVHIKKQVSFCAQTTMLIHALLKTADKMLQSEVTNLTIAYRLINSLASGWFWRFSQKNSSFRLPYQPPSSSANCARELFNGSNGSASLVDCTRKKIFCLGGAGFCEWRHKWSSFRVILAHVAWPRAQPLRQSVSLKFSLETRLESESFEPLIDFLAFLVQKLWSQMNKLIN